MIIAGKLCFPNVHWHYALGWMSVFMCRSNCLQRKFPQTVGTVFYVRMKWLKGREYGELVLVQGIMWGCLLLSGRAQISLELCTFLLGVFGLVLLCFAIFPPKTLCRFFLFEGFFWISRQLLDFQRASGSGQATAAPGCSVHKPWC